MIDAINVQNMQDCLTKQCLISHFSPNIYIHTLASRGLVSRDTICWRARMTEQAARIGSAVKWGAAACPPFPWTVTKNLPAPARNGPGLEPIVPVGICGETCNPKMPWIPSRAPSFNVWYAPAWPSSAGWKTSLTVPYKKKQNMQNLTEQCVDQWKKEE